MSESTPEATRVCRVCLEERSNVEDVELQPWPGDTVAACPTCRFVFDTDRDDCLRCGSEQARNYAEVEATIGDLGVPAYIAGALCDDCASAMAIEILEGKRDVPDEIRAAGNPNAVEASDAQLQGGEGV